MFEISLNCESSWAENDANSLEGFIDVKNIENGNFKDLHIKCHVSI